MKLRSDTSPKVRAIHDELLRRKTAEESFRMAQELTQFVNQLAFDNTRRLHPELSADEVWLKLAVGRLGEAMVEKVQAKRPS